MFCPISPTSPRLIPEITITANDTCSSATKIFRLLIVNANLAPPAAQQVQFINGGRSAPSIAISTITKDAVTGTQLIPRYIPSVHIVLTLQVGENQAFALGKVGEHPRLYTLKLIDSKDQIIIDINGEQFQLILDEPLDVTLSGKSRDKLVIIAQRKEENKIILTLAVEADTVLVSITNKRAEQPPATVNGAQLEQPTSAVISTSVLGISTRGLATLLQRALGISLLEAQGLSNLLTIFLFGFLVGILLLAGIVYYFLKSRGRG